MPKVTKRKKKKQKGGGLFGWVALGGRRLVIAFWSGVAFVGMGLTLVFWSSGGIGVLGEKANAALGDMFIASGFAIDRVTIKGDHQTARDDLSEALGVVVGGSLVHFDPRAARARIEGLGWVKSAAVSRLWPDSVHVSIREREPAAVWQMDGALNLIDVEGEFIREISALEYSYLPLIIGAGAPGASAGVLAALEPYPEIRKKITAVMRVSGRRWTLRLHNDTDIRLPEENYAETLKLLSKLHAVQGTLDRPLEYIDFTDPERVYLREAGKDPLEVDVNE